MENILEKVVALCKRRAFIFPGSEIYGGLANTWDYGPYGAQLKKNIKDHWWKTFVTKREDMVGMDGSILMNPKVWEASGHVGTFSDPLIDCKNCKERSRGDKLIEEKLGLEAAIGKTLEQISQIVKENNISCPKCGKSDFTEARAFNLMFKTHQGVVEETATTVYLRPETAQAIFVNFKNIAQNHRVKIPFGIAQIGKSFRNEITPGNFTFRTREFEQMEIEYFVNPNNREKINEHFEEWKNNCMQWFLELGVKKENIKFREQTKEELSHYSDMTVDIEYNFPFGWGELLGIAYRGCFDLKQHQDYSGKNLEYVDQATNTKFLPHVIEPSFGLDRSVLTFLIDAYNEEEIAEGDIRTVLKLNPKIAPVKVAILPLIKKEEVSKPARDLLKKLQEITAVEYDDSGAIGKRYRRQDEIGTPYCITFDFDGLEDNTVTIRHRDSMKQERMPVDQVESYIAAAIN